MDFTNIETIAGRVRATAQKAEHCEGRQLTQGRLLDELPGALFAAITLVWIVCSFMRLDGWTTSGALEEMSGILTRELHHVTALSTAHGDVVATWRITSMALFVRRAYGACRNLVG